MRSSSGGITALVHRLESAGHLFRRRHPTDRRSILVELSPQLVARAWLDPRGANEVQVDGGGKASTAEAIGRGGTDVIVAGSALYRADDMAAEVERIRSIAAAARAAAPAPGT